MFEMKNSTKFYQSRSHLILMFDIFFLLVSLLFLGSNWRTSCGRERGSGRENVSEKRRGSERRRGRRSGRGNENGSERGSGRRSWRGSERGSVRESGKERGRGRRRENEKRSWSGRRSERWGRRSSWPPRPWRATTWQSSTPSGGRKTGPSLRDSPPIGLVCVCVYELLSERVHSGTVTTKDRYQVFTEA